MAWTLANPVCAGAPIPTPLGATLRPRTGTIAAALDEAVPVPILSAALYERFRSRGDADSANRLLSAMRLAFGGHDEKGGGG